MARIFICYRRQDTSGHAGRLRDALSARFGSREIFRDIETIAPGEEFVHAMTRAIHSCRVFLAVMGDEWLTVEGADGKRRLDDPDDHMRRELAEALW
ncbi:MAG: toll/interleukin-1 receptor domain-containing protein [Longimicrobiales bacterium]